MGHGDEFEERAGGPYGEPEFQAFAVKVAADHSSEVVEEVTAALLGGGWTIRSYGSDGRSFEVLGRPLSPSEAWDRTYHLRAQQGIAYAEPLFRNWITDRADWRVSVEADGRTPAALSGLLDQLCGQGRDLPAARDTEWSLQLANVVQAWDDHFPGRPDPGAGVIVGHPDTGYRRHPEIAGTLLVELGFDLFRNDPDPLDELAQGFGRTPGHGTSTASAIGSPRGPAGGVSGVAPGVGIIPFRVSDTVVVLDTLNLARAIEMAAAAGAHVISISMGGLGSERLHDAVVHATDQGAIVLAAAGNCVGFVVAPALYEEVVAVAACDAARGIWRGSSRGAAVDITAPGDRVWKALADADDTLARVEQGSGTSYAVATVAGVAALWLARHGRDEIIRATGGPARVAPTFRQLLRATAVPVPSWPTGQFGGGLVDAAALLAAPLPDGGRTPTLVPTAAEHPAINRGGTATFVHLFENSMRADGSAQARNDASADGLVTALAELLGTSVDKLPVDLGQVGQELAFHFATDPSLHHRFAAAAVSVDASEESDDLVRAVGFELIDKGVSPALQAKLATRKKSPRR
jgi:thermitase